MAQEVVGTRMTGAELRALRERNRLSRPALAALAGLHPDTVKYWERKAFVDLRGHAPHLMLKALGAEHLSQKGKYPGARFSGGLSTGPKPAEGRARIAAAQRKRWRRHHKLAE